MQDTAPSLRSQIETYIENLPPRLRRRKRHLVLSVYAADGEYLAGDGVEGDLDEGLAAAVSPQAAGAYLNFSDFSQGNFRKDEKHFTPDPRSGAARKALLRRACAEVELARDLRRDEEGGAS